MRTYEGTHPWITFSLDLGRLNYKIWLLLGEILSKCEHISGVPLKPETANALHKLYLAKGALGTTAIEGNTLSEDEALQVLEGKAELPPSKQYQKQEIENIIKACDKIVLTLIEGGPTKITIADIMTYNKMVLEQLEVGSEVIPGEMRTYSVGVQGINYRGAPAEDCEFLLNRLCNWLNTDFQPPSSELDIPFAVLKAIISHIYIAWIHPFGDGNGRTARLLEFRILLASGIPTPAVHLLSNFYNETRLEYYRQLARTSESSGDIVAFIEYAATGFVEGLKSQLMKIREQQWDVAWQDYVHEKFKDMDRSSDVRRRHLVLDISMQKKNIPTANVKNISPRMAAHYALLSDKAIIRDLDALSKMGLIEIAQGMVRPKREIILSFLPPRRAIPSNSQ